MSTAVLTAVLTGPNASKADNPNLPTSPEEIAASAREAYDAGAAVVHVHLRDADGEPTADLDATLNVCSMSFATGEFRNPPDGVRRVTERMRELGIKPELELYDTGHLEVALQIATALERPPATVEEAAEAPQLTTTEVA